MSEIVAPIITDSTGQAIATAISGAVSKADKSDIAPDFSTSADYAKGSMVYYQGTLYEFTAAHNHAAWTGSDVIAVKVSSEINTLKSGLTNVASKVPIRGAFTVACSVGQNIFNRSTMTLVEGTIPTHSFAYCLFGICNHGSSLDSPNTVESDGADSIIINAKSAQNIRIVWLDMTNIPFQTT